jgi:hypothetical protein
MRRRYGEEPFPSFTDVVAAEQARLAPELARTKQQRFYVSQQLADWSYLYRGHYADQLQRWFALFSREQFHIVTLDDLASRPQKAMDEVHRFLDLPEHTYDQLEALHGGTYDEIEADAREELGRYFRPHNERLYELLDRDFGWDSVSAPAR